MNEQTFTPEELQELADQDLVCNEYPKLTEGVISELAPMTGAVAMTIDRRPIQSFNEDLFLIDGGNLTAEASTLQFEATHSIQIGTEKFYFLRMIKERGDIISWVYWDAAGRIATIFND